MFAAFRVQEQIEKALDRKVWLPSGGSLVIDRTEAMTVVDVNTGKFVGSGGNLEETVTKNNLEAAEEIVRQLRLRDIGGIIVIDFIDMVLENNRDLVLRRLVECLSRDRTKHQVAEVTSLGLVQMTRKKLGLGLAESFVENTGKNAEQPRPQSQQQGDSRRRNGNGSGKQPATPPRAAAGSTHSITDDARNALAKIAASTLHKDADRRRPRSRARRPAPCRGVRLRGSSSSRSRGGHSESISEAIIALPEASIPRSCCPSSPCQRLPLPHLAPRRRTRTRSWRRARRPARAEEAGSGPLTQPPRLDRHPDAGLQAVGDRRGPRYGAGAPTRPRVRTAQFRRLKRVLKVAELGSSSSAAYGVSGGRGP